MEKDTRPLFQITEAAHACGLSRSTLLCMEEKGLLAPAYIAPESGRRYYDNHNVARIMQIEKLKAMGLGTEEIAGYFASGGEVTELLAMLEGVKKAAIVGCANCATACQTGGEKEIQELKATLEAQGIEVVATVLPDECCHKMLVRKDTKVIRDSGAEAVVCMACGDGVQTVADNLTLPVYPSNNTMFLGQVERVGIFHEYCRMCGDCVLGSTGGICPITKCAKSLVNGPCGGQKNGKCEANPENDCAWIQIYNRLVAIGQEDKLLNARTDKGYANAVYPKHVNLRGKKV